jgi:hypothetical protein
MKKWYDVMMKDPVYCPPDDTAAKAAKLIMSENLVQLFRNITIFLENGEKEEM